MSCQILAYQILFNSLLLTGVWVWAINSNSLLRNKNGRSVCTPLHHRLQTLRLSPLKLRQPQRKQQRNLLQRRRLRKQAEEEAKMWRNLGRRVVMEMWIRQMKAWKETKVKEEGQEPKETQQGEKVDPNRPNRRLPLFSLHQMSVSTL